MSKPSIADSWLQSHRLAAWLLAGLLGLPLSAQAEEGWQHSVLIYLLAPTLDGTVGVGPADADVKVDAGTVFDTLEGAFLGMYQGEKDGYGVLLDVVYMDLGQKLKGQAGVLTGKFENKQLITMAAGTWRLNEQWQLVGGVAYTDIQADLSINGPLQQRNVGTDESWFDPLIGAVYGSDIGQRWHFSGYGLVGGFGVGSELLWSLNAAFSFQMTDSASLVLGYRYIDYDYEDGNGADRFRFDMAEYGPALGLRWDF